VRLPDRAGGLSAAGWLDRRRTPLLAGLAAGLVAVAAALVAGRGAPQEALLAARWTARAAAPLFLVAYLASTLRTLWPGPVTTALRRRRRQWGLGFALAHSIHLAALLVNILAFRPRPVATLVGGGLAYALIYLMALTSNDASQRLLGRGWIWLHRIGIHYVWLVFTISYTGRAFHADPGYHAEGRILAPLFLAALALRLYAQWRPRR
jgi:DMSO/TMAO reductase YedYZ heme-binding membrane subunit